MTAQNIWTKPRTIYAGEISKDVFWNTFLRDNLTHLKERPFVAGATGNVTTTSTSFVTMTNSSVSLTTTGGYVRFWAVGTVSDSTGGAVVTIDLAIDDVRQGHATFGTTLIQGLNADYKDNMNLNMITGGGTGGSLLAAGAHTCSLQWKVSTGTGGANIRLFAMEIC